MARVAQLLRRRWSAEQISGALAKSGELAISHETIYRRIRWDKLAGGSLWRYTRIMSNQRRKRYRGPDSRGVLPGKKHISERPGEVELRQRIGHWEGDTVMGSDLRHCVLTLVERKSGFAIIKKLKARNKEEVTRAATQAIRRHCRQFKTLTLDNGTEFHDGRITGYVRSGFDPEAALRQYEMCEDLARQLVGCCERKVLQGQVPSHDAALERALDGLRQKGWCSPPQCIWVVRRTAVLLGWEVPQRVDQQTQVGPR